METINQTPSTTTPPTEVMTSPSLSQPTSAPPMYQVVPPKKDASMRKFVFIPLLLVIIAAGIGTGFGLTKLLPKKNAESGRLTAAPGTISQNQVEVGKTYGIEDSKKFPDQSEGIIEKGGIDGEGSHHLVRVGGASQTVYLTSSVVDLDVFVGAKVQVKGETFSAQKAAWFMDVGSVKVIELNAGKTTDSATQAVPAE